MAVRISPIYDCDGQLNDAWTPPASDEAKNSTEECGIVAPVESKEANFPGSMLQHHSVREVQRIDVDIALEREQQLINITGANSGEFRLVVQDRAITVTLSMDDSANAIRSALYDAASSISSSSRETRSFSVWLNRGTDFLEIYVQFETDRTSLFTMLRVYPVSLVGEFRNVF